MNKSNATVVVEGILTDMRDKAICLSCRRKGMPSKAFWIPKSQLHRSSVLVDAAERQWIVFVPRWLAHKEGVGYDDCDADDYEEDKGDGNSFYS